MTRFVYRSPLHRSDRDCEVKRRAFFDEDKKERVQDVSVLNTMTFKEDYLTLIKAVMKDGVLDDWSCVDYVRGVWNGTRQFESTIVSSVWIQLEKEDMKVRYMSVLFRQLSGKKGDIFQVDRSSTLLALFESWSKTFAAELVEPIALFAYNREVPETVISKLMSTILHDSNAICGMMIFDDEANVDDSEMLLEALTTMKNWKSVFKLWERSRRVKSTVESETQTLDDFHLGIEDVFENEPMDVGDDDDVNCDTCDEMAVDESRSVETVEQIDDVEDDADTSEDASNSVDEEVVEVRSEDENSVDAGSEHEKNDEDDLDARTEDGVVQSDELQSEDGKVNLLKKETIDQIWKERYKFKKNGQPLAVCLRYPEWTSSARTYASQWRTLIGKDNSYVDLRSLSKLADGVMEHREDWKLNTASTTLSAMSCFIELLLPNEVLKYFGNTSVLNESKALIEFHHQNLMEMKAFEEDSQEMSEKEKRILQGKKWIDIAEPTERYIELHQSPDVIKTTDQCDLVIRLIVLHLYVMVHSPRRLEYITMKYRNYDVDEDCFYAEGSIVLNRYKTSSLNGQYKVDVNGKVKMLLDKLTSYRSLQNKSDYLFGSQQQVLESGYRTSLINRVFEVVCRIQNLSVNILRKLYVEHSRESGNLDWLTDKKEVARQMGHSVNTQEKRYKKRTRDDFPSESENDSEFEEPEASRKNRKLVAKTKRRFPSDEESEKLKQGVRKWRFENPEATRISWDKVCVMSGLSDVKRETLKQWWRSIEKHETA